MSDSGGFVAPGHVVITGAGGAIGAALATAMREAWPDAELALVDRDEVALANVARALRPDAGSPNVTRQIDLETGSIRYGRGGRGGVTTYVADLSRIDELETLVARIEQNGPVEALVNCAGIMRVQNIATWKWDDASTLLAIDLLAPLRLMDLVVHDMRERGRGIIINISSMAGRVPLRGCAYYGAAKAGLAMASEIARADLEHWGVQVLTVYPGPVRSALEAGARADYGGGGLFGRFAPTGDPTELASRIMSALVENEPRVIYPRLYGVGWTAPNLSRWFALSYGPPPVS